MKYANVPIPETATGPKLAEGITDKKGFASRWKFSVRHVDNLLAQGLPHLKVGSRRVRIVTAEGDAWMIERFGTRRLGPSKEAPAQLHKTKLWAAANVTKPAADADDQVDQGGLEAAS